MKTEMVCSAEVKSAILGDDSDEAILEIRLDEKGRFLASAYPKAYPEQRGTAFSADPCYFATADITKTWFEQGFGKLDWR